jgi:hypothetical protein
MIPNLFMISPFPFACSLKGDVVHPVGNYCKAHASLACTPDWPRIKGKIKQVHS